MGTSCPNRDGTLGTGGCAYCNNSSFSPDYIHAKDAIRNIGRTLEKGKNFFGRKYSDMRFVAYFQSYTNTHGDTVSNLMQCYRQAASVRDVVGVIIGTRPDCLPDALLHELGEMNRNECPVILEFGAESSHNATLSAVNRCHTWETTVDAVTRASNEDLSVGLHFIMGLPGESRDMMLETVRRAVNLPIDTLKFHQLQIIRGTRFANEYEEDPTKFNLFTPESYISLCRDIIDLVAPTGIAIERFVSQAPDNLLVAPRWGLKNYQFVNLLNSKTGSKVFSAQAGYHNG